MVDSGRESRDQQPSGPKSEMLARICDLVVGLFAMALIVEVVLDGQMEKEMEKGTFYFSVDN